MKAKHVEALIRQDLERDPSLIRLTVVAMTLRDVARTPEAPWVDVMHRLMVDWDKLDRELNPNCHLLTRVFFAQEHEFPWKQDRSWEEGLAKLQTLADQLLA